MGSMRQFVVITTGPGLITCTCAYALPPCIHAVAISPDGARLVTAGESGVQLWSLDAHAMIAELSDLEHEPMAVGFDPGGEFIFAGYAQGRVVRSVATARRRLELACAALHGNRAYKAVAEACSGIRSQAESSERSVAH